MHPRRLRSSAASGRFCGCPVLVVHDRELLRNLLHDRSARFGGHMQFFRTLRARLRIWIRRLRRQRRQRLRSEPGLVDAALLRVRRSLRDRLRLRQVRVRVSAVAQRLRPQPCERLRGGHQLRSLELRRMRDQV
jgi:hypothetical protein